MDERFDFAVIGGGMAGSAVAAHLAEGASVVLLEGEEHPGYHSTGRSAAVLADFYGNSAIRAITRASRPFFVDPPAGFASGRLINPRQLLAIAAPHEEDALDRLLAGSGQTISIEDAVRACPVLRPEQIGAAAVVSTTADIDVHELQQAYLRLFRGRNGTLRRAARVDGLDRTADGWRLGTTAGEIRCTTVVNAAGAWADEVGAVAGAQKLGMQAFRRTAILIDSPSGSSSAEWPILFDANESFYLKPDAGMLLLSPADESLSEPCDAQPEDIDVAIAVDRIERVTSLKVERVAHRWAGLRSFVADRSPVVGYDALAPNFFWMAALGGYGIQTVPELSRVAAALALRREMRTVGYDVEDLAPTRLAPLTHSSAQQATSFRRGAVDHVRSNGLTLM